MFHRCNQGVSAGMHNFVACSMDGDVCEDRLSPPGELERIGSRSSNTNQSLRPSNVVLSGTVIPTTTKHSIRTYVQTATHVHTQGTRHAQTHALPKWHLPSKANLGEETDNIINYASCVGTTPSKRVHNTRYAALFDKHERRKRRSGQRPA